MKLALRSFWQSQDGRWSRWFGGGGFAACLGIVGPLGTAAIAAAGMDFQKVVVPGFGAIPSSPMAAAWGDFDRDGRPDLAVASFPGVDLFRNTPEGLIPANPLIPDRETWNAIGVNWVDYDNDGDLDLFVVGSQGAGHALYRNDGGSKFVRDTANPTLLTPTLGMGSTWADADQDGWLDVVISNGGGAAAEVAPLFLGSPTGVFQRVETGPMATLASYGSGATWGDPDGDGDPDLFAYAAWSGPNLYFRNAGDGSFDRPSPSPFDAPGGPVGGAGAAWGDYDNDGDLDLFVSAGGAENGLYRNGGDGQFTLIDSVTRRTTGNPNGVVWADFDNDGWLDLLMANRTGSPHLFRNNGAGDFAAVTSGELPQQPEGSNGIAVGDYDGDGDLDVVLANWPGSKPTLYANVGATNRWLRIRLSGASSNRDGLGAVVRVTASTGAGSWTQMRQVGGEDGWGTQEAVAHFGLGSAAQATNVRVEWPSGVVSTFEQVPANQVLTVAEQPGTTLTLLPPGGVFTNAVLVTIRSSIPGGEVRYTTNGAAPSAFATLYQGPIEVRSRLTLQAQAFLNGFPVSEVASAEFVPDPGIHILPAGGVFTNSILVEITTRIPGALIHYTTDGKDPDSSGIVYTGPLRLGGRTTVKARAFFNQFPVSEVVSAEFRRLYAVEGDGIPGEWRRRYFGEDHSFDPRVAVDADPDGDGSNNLQEFILGSDPLDPKSGFRVAVRAVPEIRFQSVPGSKYRILRRDSVSGTSVVVAEELTAAGPETQFVDTSVVEPTAFYVVEPLP